MKIFLTPLCVARRVSRQSAISDHTGRKVIGTIHFVIVKAIIITTGSYTSGNRPRANQMKNVLLAVAWIGVAVPLGWGVYQSVQKSLPLFHGPAQTRPAVEINRPVRQNSQQVDSNASHLLSFAHQGRGVR